MLVLTRRPHEKIMIGDNVVLTVLGFRGNQIVIGIEAPKEVKVLREEIAERHQKEEACRD